VGGTINATVADSVAAGNGVGIGVNAQADQAAAQLMVTRSVSSNHLTGIAPNGPIHRITLLPGHFALPAKSPIV